VGSPALVALARARSAQLALQARGPAAAERELALGRRALRGLEAPLVEWRLLAVAAEVDLRRGRAGRAREARAAARALVERLAEGLASTPAMPRSFLQAAAR
jgi:hypothetical protein